MSKMKVMVFCDLISEMTSHDFIASHDFRSSSASRGRDCTKCECHGARVIVNHFQSCLPWALPAVGLGAGPF